MTRIALVDDHTILRKGLATLISARGYEVILEADNVQALIGQLANTTSPDLIIRRKDVGLRTQWA